MRLSGYNKQSKEVRMNNCEDVIMSEEDSSLASETCEDKNKNTTPDRYCSICQNQISESVIMSCAGMHSYCFDCIVRWIESKGELSCPECRKYCTSLIIPQLGNVKDSQKEGYKLKDFLEATKVLPNPKAHSRDCTCFDDEMENTCVYPSWVIESYLMNQDQLDCYQVLIGNGIGRRQAKRTIHWGKPRY